MPDPYWLSHTFVYIAIPVACLLIMAAIVICACVAAGRSDDALERLRDRSPSGHAGGTPRGKSRRASDRRGGSLPLRCESDRPLLRLVDERRVADDLYGRRGVQGAPQAPPRASTASDVTARGDGPRAA